MRQQQFEEYQSKVLLLSAKQLQQLQMQIEAKLEKQRQPLINDKELDLIYSLFRKSN